MTRQKPILVIGSLNIDLVVKVSHFPRRGETLHGEGLRIVPGGKGGNQAVTIAKLGGKVKMVGRIGEDYFGKVLEENMRKVGIETEYILKHPSEPTGIAFIIVDKEGTNTILAISGANKTLDKETIESVNHLFKECALLITQLEIPLETVKYALTMAKTYKLPVILDPGPPRKCPPELLTQVDILAPNEQEAHFFTGIEVKNINSARKAASMFLSWGVKAVLLKLGERGVFVVSREGEIYIPGIKVKAVDTTAAGDAFLGAFALKYAEKKNLLEAVSYGNYAGALTATRFGAQPSLPSGEEIEKFIAKKRKSRERIKLEEK